MQHGRWYHENIEFGNFKPIYPDEPMGGAELARELANPFTYVHAEELWKSGSTLIKALIAGGEIAEAGLAFGTSLAGTLVFAVITGEGLVFPIAYATPHGLIGAAQFEANPDLFLDTTVEFRGVGEGIATAFETPHGVIPAGQFEHDPAAYLDTPTTCVEPGPWAPPPDHDHPGAPASFDPSIEYGAGMSFDPTFLDHDF